MRRKRIRKRVKGMKIKQKLQNTKKDFPEISSSK